MEPSSATNGAPWLKTAGEAVGLIAGAVALVYLLGGAVYALRLAFAGFSPEAIVNLVGQLPRESVITAGFVEGLGPALLVGLVAALAYGAAERPKPRAGEDDALNKGPRWGLTLLGLLVLSLALVAPALALATDGPSWELATSVLGIAVTYPLVCSGWFFLRRLGRHPTGWYRLSRAVAAGAIWACMALVPSIMLSGAVPFEPAWVCVEGRDDPEEGDLIADTKERVLVAAQVGGEMTVVSLPVRRLERLQYGAERGDARCPVAATGGTAATAGP